MKFRGPEEAAEPHIYLFHRSHFRYSPYFFGKYGRRGSQKPSSALVILLLTHRRRLLNGCHIIPVNGSSAGFNLWRTAERSSLKTNNSHMCGQGLKWAFFYRQDVFKCAAPPFTGAPQMPSAEMWQLSNIQGTYECYLQLLLLYLKSTNDKSHSYSVDRKPSYIQSRNKKFKAKMSFEPLIKN